MTPSAACLALIKQFEGLRLTAYPDPATHSDPWTIGVGHTGPEVHKDLVWTQQQADAALAADLAHTASAVTSLIGNAATSQNQFDALVSLAFNIGLANLAKSTLLSLHRVGNYAAAALQFPRWDKAAGRVMQGLLNRRNAEMALYEGEQHG